MDTALTLMAVSLSAAGVLLVALLLVKGGTDKESK